MLLPSIILVFVITAEASPQGNFFKQKFVSSALLINFTEISVVRRTEISVMKCTTENSVRHTTEISVKMLTSKADEKNSYTIIYCNYYPASRFGDKKSIFLLN